MLHTIRQIINNDEKWRQILRGLNSTFYHQTVTTKQIENYISEQAGVDLSLVFNQYLRDTRVPTLEYYFKEKQLVYRWINCVDGFTMPVQIDINGELEKIQPTNDWKTLKVTTANPIVTVDSNYYVAAMNSTK
jgi:aminopeptidase N